MRYSSTGPSCPVQQRRHRCTLPPVRVLVVEDDRTIADFVSDGLKREGSPSMSPPTACCPASTASAWWRPSAAHGAIASDVTALLAELRTEKAAASPGQPEAERGSYGMTADPRSCW